MYQRGQRVRLESTDDPWTKLKPGDEGTVSHLDDAKQVIVCWDSGSHLSMIVEDHPLLPRKPGDRLDRISVIAGEPKFCSNCQMAEEVLRS